VAPLVEPVEDGVGVGVGPAQREAIDAPAGEQGEQLLGLGLKLFGKLENVFDREYFEDGFRSPGIWGTAGLAFEF
jgi:hypothetical protein